MLLKDVADYVEFSREKLKNSTRRNRCPICSGVGCGVNSQIVLCWRVEAGSKEQVRSGAYLHFRDKLNSTYPIVINSTPEPKAQPELITQVYNSLLSCLVLTDKHQTALNARGLSNETIRANEYRSTPTRLDGQLTCKYLSSLFNLDYVPGFYQDETGIRRLNAQGSGIFIPYRDVKGTIKGMQVRPDRSSSKYFWFSSADFFKGASSGSCIHFARPDKAKELREVYITEGALKADCIAELGQVGVVAIAGVNAVNYDTLALEIKNSLPGVRFGSGSVGMKTNYLRLYSAHTIYIVYNYRSASSTTRRALQGVSSNWLIGPYSNVHTCYAGGFSTGLAVTQNVFVAQAVVYSPGSNTNYVNNTAYTSGGTTAIGSAIGLGVVGQFAEPLDGDILEIKIVGRADDSTQRGNEWTYFQGKYSL